MEHPRLIFSEILELTGYTASYDSAVDWNYTTFKYPSGFNQSNTRPLSVQIYVDIYDKWESNGSDIHCSLKPNYMVIIYPDKSEYRDKQFRMVLMKVE